MGAAVSTSSTTTAGADITVLPGSVLSVTALNSGFKYTVATAAPKSITEEKKKKYAMGVLYVVVALLAFFSGAGAVKVCQMKKDHKMAKSQ